MFRLIFNLILLVTSLFACCSCSAQVEEDVIKKRTDEIPVMEYEPSAICDSFYAIAEEYAAKKYKLFMRHVYNPAMKDSSVSKGNKAFLKRLKYYLECENDSCARFGNLIYPVYKLNGGSVHLVKTQPQYTWYMKKSDSTLSVNDKKVNYTIVYARSADTSVYHLKKYKEHRGSPTYIVEKNALKENLTPAFAIPFALDLEYTTNKKLNALFAARRSMSNTCLSGNIGNKTISFARLKNVTALYFIYAEGESQERGLALVADGKFPLFLWEHEWGWE
jgi:hypothetical protein